MGSRTRANDKLKRLEKAWNSNVSHDQEPRRLAQMTEDIKHFIVKSMSDGTETQKLVESFQKERQTVDTFTSIASTLGFRHHEGTDSGMELRIIKVIMMRESLLMSLKFSAEQVERQGNLEGNNLLPLMAQMRETTINYLSFLNLWRQTASTNGDGTVRAFIWENENYTMKVINDLDFLSENPVIIDTLNLTQEQLRCNPLMLSNNLEDINTWMAPEDRALADCQGDSSHPDYRNRLTLRHAERLLLLEMESNNFAGSQIFMTQNGISPREDAFQQQQQMYMQQPFVNSNNQPIQVGSNALEEEVDSGNDQQLLMYDYPSSGGKIDHLH